jgi:hypothetical protein
VCSLKVLLGADRALTYEARTRGAAKHGDVAIERLSETYDRHIGKIWFNDVAVDHKLWTLVIGGAALSPSAVSKFPSQ